MSNFTNSSLVSYTRISPNKNSPRTESTITKIIVHHIAGVASVESFGEIVSKPERQMSANYAIGNDGRIGLYCEEKDRCWCSSSRWADNRGIAIEVSNSKLGEPWPVSTKAWNSLVNLCADICKRNNIPKMTYTGDENGVLMFHRWFAATGCVPIDTTDVLTPNGWRSVRDIKIGDKVASVSPSDGFTIHFDPVENMTPVHKDTTFTINDMTITKEHRVLYSDPSQYGFHIDEFQKICDKAFAVPTAGAYNAPGMNIESSEMVFLLEMQRIGSYDYEKHTLEFRYIMESKVQYFYGLLKNLGYKFEKVQEDLGPVRFTITDSRAWELCETYLSGKDFNWKWLEMNPTQFSYFIYKATSHVDTGWSRKYESDSIVNIDVIQALCALNERGSKYVASENALYVDQAYRSIDPHVNMISNDDVDVACITTRTGCFLMRQHGVTTITGNCPGEYIFSRAQQLCNEVNAKLGTMDEPKPESSITIPTASNTSDIKVGDLVHIMGGAKYYNGNAIPSWVISQAWYVSSISNDRVVIDKNEARTASINSPVYLKDVQKATTSTKQPVVPYTKYLQSGTGIYMILNDNKIQKKDMITVSTRYTIVDEKQVGTMTLGLLKSGAGWIVLNESSTINVGDSVTVQNAVTYDGKPFVVYEKTYKVLRIDNDRVVISSDGVNVTAAVNITNLKKK